MAKREFVLVSRTGRIPWCVTLMPILGAPDVCGTQRRKVRMKGTGGVACGSLILSLSHKESCAYARGDCCYSLGLV